MEEKTKHQLGKELGEHIGVGKVQISKLERTFALGGYSNAGLITSPFL